MFGMIAKMRTTPGGRDRVVAILTRGADRMPGCLSYIVAIDPADPHVIWVTELWDSAESHKASLSLPDVRAAIDEARPLIAGFEMSVRTEPVGGVGLPA